MIFLFLPVLIQYFIFFKDSEVQEKLKCGTFSVLSLLFLELTNYSFLSAISPNTILQKYLSIYSLISVGIITVYLVGIALKLNEVEKPSKVAERLPKILIHRNVEGEAIHTLLKDLDEAWLKNSSLSTFSAAQRWIATCRDLKNSGWPITNNQKRWALGELTLDYEAVAPLNLR